MVLLVLLNFLIVALQNIRDLKKKLCLYHQDLIIKHTALTYISFLKLIQSTLYSIL